MVAVGEYLGKGAYHVSDAARLVRAPYRTIRHWLDPQDGAVHRVFDPTEQTIGFLELMELHFVRMFRDEGVSLQAIRKAAQTAARRFEGEHPFAMKRFDTDGKSIFATLVKEANGGELVEDLRRGQYVFTTIIRPFFRKLDYSNKAEVSRFWPLSKDGRVVLDPLRQFGRPIDSETGVPTRALYNAVNAGRGQSLEKVARWFNVPEAAVHSAVDFERSLV